MILPTRRICSSCEEEVRSEDWRKARRMWCVVIAYMAYCEIFIRRGWFSSSDRESNIDKTNLESQRKLDVEFQRKMDLARAQEFDQSRQIERRKIENPSLRANFNVETNGLIVKWLDKLKEQREWRGDVWEHE